MGGILILHYTHHIYGKRGISFRAARQLAKLAKEAKGTNIAITKGDTTVKASQTMRLLALGVKQGDEINFTIDGPNENEVIRKIHQFLNFNL